MLIHFIPDSLTHSVTLCLLSDNATGPQVAAGESLTVTTPDGEEVPTAGEESTLLYLLSHTTPHANLDINKSREA